MLKNNHAQHFTRQIHEQSHDPSFHFYRQSLTEPLKSSYGGTHQQQKPQKREKKALQMPKNRESHEIYIKIVEEEAIGNPVRPRPKHKKGKSMDLQMITERMNSSNDNHSKDHPEKTKKIIINSNFIHQMRKRNVNSEMNHYNQTTKNNKIDDKIEGKRKKKKSFEYQQASKKTQRYVIQINTTHTAPSNIKKKNSKRHMQHSLTLSTKFNKAQQRSAQLLQQRRCKSSLKEKMSSKMLGGLKAIGNSLPLTSKLNSLYSNTTSIYNSHNDISIIQKKIGLRIPTEEQTVEKEEMRRYESLVLNRDNSIKVLRNARHQNLRAVERPLVEPECIKTEDIISNYVLKFQAESQPEIMQPVTLEQINEICHQTRVDVRPYSIENSFIERLDSVSIDEHLKENEGESNKLNEIIAIIERGGKNLVQDTQDKEYIINTIKQIIQNKKMKEQEEIFAMDKYEAGEPKTKTFVDSNSINASSLSSSMVSETDISILNLEILNKALRQREQYLQNRLKKQIQKIQQQEQSDGGAGRCDQIERVTKWITNQIKEVQHTRTQLWKGFNVAKNLLKDQLTDKNKEMMRCLSEKYIHKTTHGNRLKKQAKLQQKQEQSPQLKNYEWSKLNDAMCEQRKSDDGQNSPLAHSPLIEQNPLHYEDLRFLTNNYSNQQLQSQSESGEQNYDSPESLSIKLKKIEEESIEKDRSLKRQRLNCESPHSDSESESYGAIIIEREDTFLFSSEKKENSSFQDLSIEDKEDICQFLFLDLCIEINEELGRESRVMKQLDKFIRKMKEQTKKQKGFKTNSNAIKQYLSSFIIFLKSRPELIEEIHQALDKPMGPTTIEILRYMHTYNEDVDQDNESYVLTAKIFDAFEDLYMRSIKLERYYEDEEREAKRRLFIKNAAHIHNKAIYDAYNEALDKDRPFGIWGEPFTWKKIAKFTHTRDTRAKNDILLKRAQQTIEFSNFMCGFIVDKEDCALKDNPSVTDAYIEQIRYDRLSQMMAKELEEGQERMRFFDDEETQLLVDMANSIFTRLVLEVCDEFTFIL